MRTVKTVLRFSYLVSLALLPTLIAEQRHKFMEEEPVYWVDNSKLVYSEYAKINLDVKLVSPCDLDAFPAGFNKSQLEVVKLRLDCIKRYHEMFLLPLSGPYHCGYRGRDSISIDKGNKTVNVKLALLVGYGSIYLFSSINRDDDISKMKLGNVESDDLVKMVESKLSEEGSFADLLGLSVLKMREGGWNPFGESAFLFKVVEYWWNKKSLNEDFLKVIGIEDYRKVFGDVLLKPVGNFDCSFDLNWENLRVTFSLPKINRDLRMFHPEAFELTESFKDYTCVLKYNGTQNVVWSKEQNCIVAKDVTEPGNMSWFSIDKNRRMFLIESNSCIPMSNKNTPYFALSACFKQGMWKPKDFFDSKWMNQTEYRYCNGGFINWPTENDLPTACPPYVFRPNSTSFPKPLRDEQTHIDFDYDGITVIPASISKAVNRILFPAPLNTTAILMSEVPTCV